MSIRNVLVREAVRLAVVVALFGVVAAGTSSAPASAASKVQSCPAVTAGGQSYSVTVTKVSCTFAKKWVGKLAGKRVESHAVRSTLSGGPSGYTCFGGAAPSGSSVPGVASNVQTNGSCRKGLLATAATPYFNWTNAKVGKP